ncbi:hypothetical protein FB45DRAFT_1037172 [Roridomyces roridus]|uniref:Uncharacterized protein n=1 Tax=Roridomyces roridus TaxID=1738132 RepID=A0AAD7FAH8_9AGAR|nr:hypothetical protein FB45DRAFT_1037172 [Roridomyces roridus]
MTTADSPAASKTVTSVLIILAQIKAITPDIARTILAQGIIPSLVSALVIEGIPPFTTNPVDPPVEMYMAPYILISYLELIPGYRWTVQVVRAGLIERVIAWGEKLSPSASDPGIFPNILRVVLPRILMCPSAIVELKTAISRLDTASSSTAFSQSVLHLSWMAFKSIVDRHGALLEICRWIELNQRWRAATSRKSLAAFVEDELAIAAKAAELPSQE